MISYISKSVTLGATNIGEDLRNESDEAHNNGLGG